MASGDVYSAKRRKQAARIDVSAKCVNVGRGGEERDGAREQQWRRVMMSNNRQTVNEMVVTAGGRGRDELIWLYLVTFRKYALEMTDHSLLPFGEEEESDEPAHWRSMTSGYSEMMMIILIIVLSKKCINAYYRDDDDSIERRE